MKFLFRYLESDSWMGSLYAYTFKVKPENDQIFYPKKRIDFKCQNCGLEFFSYDNPEFCEVCDSDNLTIQYENN